MRMDTPNNMNPVGSKANPTRMDILDNANSLCDSTGVRNVRPNELIEPSNAYEQMSSYAQAAPRANYANPYRYSEHTPNAIPMVQWNEPPLTGSNPRQAVYTPMAQTSDLFVPDEFVYYTARQTGQDKLTVVRGNAQSVPIFVKDEL